METVRSLGFTAGPLVGGALGAAGLLRLALALNALSFAVVGVAGARAARAAASRRQSTTRRCAPATASSSSPAERDLALPLGGAVAALTIFTMSATAEPFFVTDVLGAGSLGYGVLITAWTLGMAAGAAGLAHRVPAAQPAPRARSSRSSSQGAGLAGAAVSPVLWMALIGFAFGGVAHGVKNVLLRTLIHERVPEALRGRAFAAYNGARNGAELGALALGGLVVGAFGARPALLIAGVGPAADRPRLLLVLTMRRRAAAATTIEGSVIHARVQG